MMTILDIIDYILFFLMAFSVLYLMIFAIASQTKRKDYYPDTDKKYRFVVLFPAYKEDNVIVSSIKSFLKQDYPSERFEVVVISDSLKSETNIQLSILPIKLLKANYKKSSKAKALNFAINNLDADNYDVVVIMDADNTVDSDFLDQLNKAYASGITAIQAHRVAKGTHTDMAILDAVSEEINNSFFRKGHVQIGLSSALSGSGMAFDYKWFEKNIKKVSSVGEDKELEMQLLSQRVYIDYLENVFVYDQKVQSNQAFNNQRRRWLATQYNNLYTSFKYLPKAILSGNIDFCNKIIQWFMLPRLMLLGLIFICAFLSLFVSIFLSVKWWILLFFMTLALAIALPDEMLNERFYKVLRKLPLLFVMMVINLFHLKEGNKKFIHTEHESID